MNQRVRMEVEQVRVKNERRLRKKIQEGGGSCGSERGRVQCVPSEWIEGEGWAPCGPEGPHGAPGSTRRRTGLKPRAPRAAAI